MRIFALETDNEKLQCNFLTENEELMLVVRFHGFLFFVKAFVSFIFTIVLVLLGWGAWNLGMPGSVVTVAVFFTWLVLIFFRLMRAFIDWRFDVMILTNEKLVIIDQTSIFHVNKRQMNLENIASVSAESQFWGLFPFGTLHFELKEGTGKSLCLAYIPQADHVASVISNSIINFQRRREVAAH